jgi:hypothetical protein
MPDTPKKQTKDEDFHNYPFDAEIFRRTFNGYVRKFNTIFIVLVTLISAPFVAYVIAWYLEMTTVDISGFLDLWHAGESLLLDLGFPYISYKFFSSGIVSFGSVSFGIISIGANVSCGVISIGGFISCGVISIGGLSSVGLVAIGNNNVYGLIAIATGNKKPFVKDEYMNGKAVGFIAVGRDARGTYALSYDEKGEGTYLLSPKRQDPEAVTLFTQWFRKFKGTFVLPS